MKSSLLGLFLGVICSLFLFTPLFASADTIISGTLPGSTTWTKENGPYVINAVSIPAGSSLTILPGTIVKVPVNANALTIDGALVTGGVGAPVVITSLRDDTVGGDTNGDGVATVPSSGDWRTILFNSGSTGNITNTIIRYGGASPFNPSIGGVDWLPAIQNDGGTLVFDHATLINNGNFGLLQLHGTTTVTNSEIASTARYGIWITNGTFSVHNSSFHSNATFGLYNGTTNIMDATNNWWGATSGPTHSTNPGGRGDAVSDYVNFANWTGSDPTQVCTVNCYSNVLFLPGIEASRLYDVSGNEIWLSDNDAEADYLLMATSGESVHQDITTQDVLDETGIAQAKTNIYKSFLGEMKNWESAYHITATTTPYDWRLDYDAVISTGRKLSNGHISYLASPESGHDPYILETLKQLAATSPTGKVTIIGHSQGGLIAKALMQKLGDAATAQLIDKVILVATPQLGTPQAIAVLLNGADAGIPFAISNEKARRLAQNMQSAYNLLPSAPYFTQVDDSVIAISSSSLPTWTNHYGDMIHWDAGMRNFMYDADVVRTKPAYTDLNTPEIVDPLKLLRAQEVHSALDNWAPPIGVQLTTVAGWGMETLPGGVYGRECKNRDSLGSCAIYGDKITLEPQHIIDGDGTVAAPSAQWANATTSKRWWVDLKKYNHFVPNQFATKHADILEVPELRTLLKNIIIGTSTQLDYVSVDTPQYTGSSPRLHFILHSPLTLEFYDATGKHVGYSTSTGQIDLNVPGVEYERYGEVQWISIPKELAGQLVMHGTDSGFFTLDIEEVSGNDTLSVTSFEGIPSSTNTVVVMSIIPAQSMTGSSTLIIDEDGNGTSDLTLQAKQGAIVTLPPPDLIPPATAASTTGILGKNGWYTSNALVTLTATDTDSGVASTTYSLNGATWLVYSVPITIAQEGINTLLYRSTDKKENIEIAKILSIKIDKTAPESQISVSTSTQDLFIEGTDNLSTTTVTKDVLGNYTIADQAGHTTKLFFTKTYSGKLLTYSKLISIQYDAAAKVAVPASSFLYVWDTKSPNILLSQTITVSDTYAITAAYDKTRNKTTTVILKKNLPIQTLIFSGLKIVKLTTLKGVIGYSL